MGSRVGLDAAFGALLLGLALSMAIAWIYSVTYQGVGYLRSFVQTIAMCGPVAALVMLAIGDDIARGLGMVGALTMIRFRATLKDTRDLIFIFAALGVGVACGVQAFVVALCGAGIFISAVLFLTWSHFGSRQDFDAVLRFRLPVQPARDDQVRAVLDKHCRKQLMIDMRTADGQCQEYTYHLRLARPDLDEPALMRDLEGIPGVQDALLLRQEASLEP